jgi:hypothetical protein
MPALTTCPLCGFDGPHGFTDAGPYTTMFYHGGYSDGCRWYQGVGGKVFESRAEAAQAVHDHDPRYDGLWLAYMLNERTKLGHLHRKRCTGGGLEPKDREYIRSKGITLTW